jgi:tRNA-2-methylthio-N6-dimethylallyladenosine synthase
VHFLDPDGLARPGDLVTTTITYAAPHHLVADQGIQAVERTRGGDAHEAATAVDTPDQVMLGLPTLRSI